MASISSISESMVGKTSISESVVGNTSISDMVDSGTGGQGCSTVVILSNGGESRHKSGNLVNGSAQISIATGIGNISSDSDGDRGSMVVESMDITLLPLFSGFSGSGHSVESETKTISVSKVSQTKTISISKVSESVMGYDSMVGVSVMGVSNRVHGADSIGEVGTMTIEGAGYGGEEQTQADRRLHIGLLVACNQQIPCTLR